MLAIQAAVLASILEDTEYQLSIVKGSLVPQHPFRPNLNCPDLQVSLDEQNIWRIQNYCDTIRTIIQDTIKSLKCKNSFEPLINAVCDTEKCLKEENLVHENYEVLGSKLCDVRDELVACKESLKGVKYYGMLSMLKYQLDEEERIFRNQCDNKLSYWCKFLLAKRDGRLKIFTMAEDEIRNEILEVKQAIKQEKRNTLEMRSYLNILEANITNEINDLTKLKLERTREHNEKMCKLKLEREEKIKSRCRAETLFEQVKEGGIRKGFKKGKVILTYEDWLQCCIAEQPMKKVRGKNKKKRNKKN